MIIESIRLKHVKSYGAGPDGDGVTVPFEPGVNRIAGANGHGKTTLVEALGYALFFADPLFEENFRAETYLLSHGARAGEIDVSFDVGGARYRVERGVGTASKRRAKVVDLADGSICAEGDREVTSFLCQVLQLPSPDRLSELFSKLIGVKQGRLTWPFDSKAGDAKRFFEPLLEVEVFRQCFDRLKPVADRFDEQRREREHERARLDERIRERADAADRLRQVRSEVADHSSRLEAGLKGQQAALADKTAQEGREREVTSASRAGDEARAERRNTAEWRQEAATRLGESEAALKQVEASAASHAAYQGAQAALTGLEERRKRRDALREEREGVEARRIAMAGSLEGVRGQHAMLMEQHVERSAARAALVGRLVAVRDELDASRPGFERGQEAAATARDDGAAVFAWVKGLAHVASRTATLASSIAISRAEIAAWDGDALAAATGRERHAAAAATAARGVVVRIEERARTLRAQLEQIAGGVCPFLNESCPRFDPNRVQADLSNLDAELAARREEAAGAERAHRETESVLAALVATENQLKAKREALGRDLAAYSRLLGDVSPGAVVEALGRLAAWDAELQLPVPDVAPWMDWRGPDPSAPHAPSSIPPERVTVAQQAVERFVDDAASWWPGAQRLVADGLQRAEAARTERTLRDAEAQNLAAQVREIEEAIGGLARDAARKETEAREHAAALRTQVERIRDLDEQLEPLRALDAAIERHAEAREAHKAGFEAYLLAKPLADDFENRKTRLGEVTALEQQIEARLALCEERLARACEAFDPEKLAAARQGYEAAVAVVAAAGANLEHARIEQGKQEERLAQWQAAVAARADVMTTVARLDAARDLTDLARKVLRDAAPAVAQHLCTRIAARAQAVYNQINADPVELAWEAEHYSLRIAPGDRRFAMLSGGEQTKLALAMTLAMVEEFSRLRFCVFDEPTYGVDADSRGKLADAILQVQDAAALDQVLLVSHDDAFEDRIEHTVLLAKSAAGGTGIETR